MNYNNNNNNIVATVGDIFISSAVQKVSVDS